MGDCSTGRAGERFIAEFGADYRRVSGFDPKQRYVIVSHGLVYDDFHREVKYGLLLRPGGTLSRDATVEVVLAEPAAYDTEVHDPVDEIRRVARDLDLPMLDVFKRFKRADLVPEEFSLADFPPEILKEMSA